MARLTGRRLFPLSALALLLAMPLAGLGGAAQADIRVRDAYARTSGPAAMAGAVFFEIENDGAADDRLIAAETQVAQHAALHSHQEGADGVMRMRPVAGGLPVAAGSRVALVRGGLHVMLMGLTAPLTEGATFPLVLTFEEAGTVTVDVTVDTARPATEPAQGN